MCQRRSQGRGPGSPGPGPLILGEKKNRRGKKGKGKRRRKEKEERRKKQNKTKQNKTQGHPLAEGLLQQDSPRLALLDEIFLNFGIKVLQMKEYLKEFHRKLLLLLLLLLLLSSSSSLNDTGIRKNVLLMHSCSRKLKLEKKKMQNSV